MDLRRSRRLTGAVAAAHLSALVLLVCSGAPVWIIIPAVVAVAASARSCYRGCRWPVDPVNALEINAAGAVAIHIEDGWHPCIIGGDSVVTPLCMVLQLNLIEFPQRRHLILMPDCAKPEDLRRLRIWLRWQWRAVEAAPQQAGQS